MEAYSRPVDIPVSEDEKHACATTPFEELFDRPAMAEQQRDEEASLRYLAEEDLDAQIQEVLRYQVMYHEEWEKRKSVEAELAGCKAELETAKKKVVELHKLMEDPAAESCKRDVN